jgi:hypothetical protein
MRLTEWSGKSTVEDKQYVRLPTKIGQPDKLTFEIGQGKVWCWGVKCDLWHLIPF